LDLLLRICPKFFSLLQGLWHVHASDLKAQSPSGPALQPEIEESSTLSEQDWDLLLSDAHSLLMYAKDEIIVKQGKPPKRLFQVSKGSCRLRITENGKSKKLGILQAGDTFGELSFLLNCSATADVIADQDEVEIIALDAVHLRLLFHSDAGLAARFYRYLAGLIADRLFGRDDTESLQLSQLEVSKTNLLKYKSAIGT